MIRTEENGLLVARYFIDFIIFSFFGWVYECIFCTWRKGKWQNRGFLYGPVCPIYGAGVVAALGLFSYAPHFNNGNVPIWQIFLICAAGSAVLEFSTSWVLEKFFHAIWWDYSSMPLNIQGRICLPYTCCFGLAGIAVVKLVMPVVARLEAYVAPYPLVIEFVALILMLILGGDLALTVASLSELIPRIEEMQASFNDRAQAGVELMQEGPTAVGRAAVRAAKQAASEAKSAAAEAAGAARERLDAATDSARERLDAATDSARERWDAAADGARERLEKMASTLSRRQKYHVSSIVEVRGRGGSGMLSRLRKVMEEMQNRIDDVAVRREGGDGGADKAAGTTETPDTEDDSVN